MALSHTRTHVHYFAQEQVDELEAVYLKIKAEGESRLMHVSSDVKMAMRMRLQALEAAIFLLRDPVP